MTDSTTSLGSRLDYQMMTNNVYNFSPTSTGLQLIPGTYQVFGNNGSTAYHGTTNNSNKHIAAGVVQNGATYIDESTLRSDLVNASDHLPVMADYTLGPGVSTWTGGGTSLSELWLDSQNWDSTPLDGDQPGFRRLDEYVQIDNTACSPLARLRLKAAPGRSLWPDMR